VTLISLNASKMVIDKKQYLSLLRKIKYKFDKTSIECARQSRICSRSGADAKEFESG